MIDARASGGAQLSAIDDAAALREANSITLKGTLSTLRDLDWAEAIGRYEMENTALQAAQTVFMQMQSLSLFKLMG
jgi:flagellar hook-associated protein 3 FlgL